MNRTATTILIAVACLGIGTLLGYNIESHMYQGKFNQQTATWAAKVQAQADADTQQTAELTKELKAAKVDGQAACAVKVQAQANADTQQIAELMKELKAAKLEVARLDNAFGATQQADANVNYRAEQCENEMAYLQMQAQRQQQAGQLSAQDASTFISVLKLLLH